LVDISLGEETDKELKTMRTFMVLKYKEHLKKQSFAWWN